MTPPTLLSIAAQKMKKRSLQNFSQKSPDIVVIGSGIAGLLSALSASEKGSVLLVTKKKLSSGSTPYAQGGIAAVLSGTDHFEKHIEDTMKAGAFHNSREVVKYVVQKGPQAIQKLIEFGVKFDQEKNKNLALGLEGGHSENRIIHAKDATGRIIEKALIAKVRSHKNITIWENTLALDLIIEKKTCKGIRLLRNKKIIKVPTQVVVLCTGGTGQVFAHTTNPTESTGDGIAIALRAGAGVRDMEFIQFHPTAFFKKENNRHFLLSEAIRGEGGILINHEGKRFTKELAARDILSRAIYEEQKHGKVFLTFENTKSTKRKKLLELKKRFPEIFTHLKKNGYILGKNPIPITPVAHYLCGGIEVNLRSETSIKNLFAIGECARTGLHGANRLASNSLLEAAVFASEIGGNLPKIQQTNFKIKEISEKNISNTHQKIIKKIQEIMWQEVGIIRTKNGLQKAFSQLNKFKNHKSREVKNLATVAIAICKQALQRKKSLGCHTMK